MVDGRRGILPYLYNSNNNTLGLVLPAVPLSCPICLERLIQSWYQVRRLETQSHWHHPMPECGSNCYPRLPRQLRSIGNLRSYPGRSNGNGVCLPRNLVPGPRTRLGTYGSMHRGAFSPPSGGLGPSPDDAANRSSPVRVKYPSWPGP